MKLKTFLFPLLAAVSLSCARDYSEPAPQPGDSLPATPTQTATESEDTPSFVKVLFSEEMTALVEDDLSKGSLRTRSKGLNEAVAALGVESMERLFPFAGEYEPRTRKEGLHRWYKVRFAQDIPVTRAAETLEALPGVESVEQPIRATLATSDTRWSDQWALNNTRYPGFDVGVQQVWEHYTVGNSAIIVAVVDGGIDIKHPDLAWNCLPESYHKNYVSRASAVVGHDHGTHVAGTIAAVTNNGLGIAGIAGGDYAKGRRGISLLSQQCFYTVGTGQSAHDVGGDFETAVKEAADHGALICSNSWGYNFDSNDDGKITGDELAATRRAHENVRHYAIARAIDYFVKYAGCDNDGKQKPDSPMQGGLVVFAAGNENIPYGPPANYDPCVAVGAITMSGSRASYSNYGEWVDICAPGSSIVSTYPGGGFVTYSGTSMACPHVSGVASLILSHFGGQGFTVDALKNRLFDGARDIGLSSGDKPVGHLVDAYGSFVTNDTGTPSAVEDFSIVPLGHNLRVDFAGGGGTYGYMALAARSEEALRKTSLSMLDAGIESAHLVIADTEEPVAPRSISLLNMDPETDYYVCLVAYSYGRRYSALSPIKKIHTGTNAKPTISTDAGASLVFRQFQEADVPFTILDPDQDTLKVDFQTNGRATLKAGMDGRWHFRLTCQAVRAPASFQATLIVSDRFGARASRSFTYSVLENVPPVLSTPFDPVILSGSGQATDIPLAAHFSDEDGEPLEYKVSSLDPSLLGAELLEGGILRITARDNGLVEVRVSATDAMGAAVRADIQALVRASGEKVTILEGTVFSDKLTILTADKPVATTLRLVSSSGAMAAEVSGTFSAFDPVVLDTRPLAPGRYTLYVDMAGTVVRRTLVKK